MNISFSCQRCEETSHIEVDDNATAIGCPFCDHKIQIPLGAIQDGRIKRCVMCPSKELYIRKNFPQQLGVTIVAIGFALSCIPWYFHNWYGTFAILFTTAIIDLVLYLMMGNVLQCYRCHAIYRGLTGLDHYEPFDLEIHERHRQELARLKENETTMNSRTDAGSSESPYESPVSTVSDSH